MQKKKKKKKKKKFNLQTSREKAKKPPGKYCITT